MKTVEIDFFTKICMLSQLKADEDRLFVIGKYANLEDDKYDSDLYELVDGKLKQLTYSHDVSQYDIVSHQIIFRSNRANDERSNFYVLPPFGEAQLLFSLEQKVENIYYIDQSHFLFTASTHLESDSFETGEECRVFEEVPFYFNGAGDVSKKRSSLFIYEEGEVKQLSKDTMDIQGVYLSPGKEYALIIGEDYEGLSPENNSLYYVDYHENTWQEISLYENCDYYRVDFCNELEAVIVLNRQLHYEGIENAGFYLYHTKTHEIHCINDGDRYSIGNSVGSDIKMGNKSSDLIFDDQGFAFITTDNDHAPLAYMDSQGNVSMLTHHKEMVQEVIYHNHQYWMIMMEEDKPNEIYTLDNKLSQVTHIHDEMMNEYEISTPQEIFYESDAGKLNGYVMKPIGFEEGKKYPTILDVHGGPKTVYGPHFFHEMQYWTAQGYGVIFTNIRGSDGRGNAFSDIRGKYGTIDYDDLMAFVDSACKQCDWIDEEHLGITGGSYGGFMTNWVIGHTDRFKAAASQRSISNWVSFANTSDIGPRFTKTHIQGTPWDHIERLWEQSPLKYAGNCTTPTLFIHSDCDYRCPMSEGIQMFNALKVYGVPARLCLFKGENHELSRSGKPDNRIRRLDEITHWMDKYLK